MDAPRLVQIDLDALWEPLAVGLQRAGVFAGLGINAANDPRLVNHRLPGSIKMIFVPDAITDEQLAECKHEFGLWILGNALREALEALETSLENVFRACSFVAAAMGKPVAIETAAKAFVNGGIGKRLKLLQAHFGIDSDRRIHLQSIVNLRNCLTHRRGFVAERDCNEPGRLLLKYQRLKFGIQRPNGEIVELPEEITAPIHVDVPGSWMVMQYVEAEKPFPLGARVLLSVPEMRDILFTFDRVFREMKPRVVEHFRAMGVPINEKLAGRNDEPA
ncbi:MAG TPA: hypothetical protein VNE82_10465 [Candidatus Binataceae bacterium]|nr:hypothetical protein [Candidatus Binataceae bacterium]HVB80348.1 hypothetical protein [Candidatus Binataceae bacterium]